MDTLAPTPRSGSVNAILLALVVAMDACWVYAAGQVGYVALFGRLPQIYPAPEPLVLAGLQGAAMILAAALLRWEWLPLSVARLTMGLVGLLAIANYGLLVHPPDLTRPFLEWLIKMSYPTVVGLTAWVLGSTRYSDRGSFTDVYTSFRNGLLIMGGAVVLGALLLLGSPRGARMLEEVGTIPVWFFVWALAALGIANRELVREESGAPQAGSGSSIWYATVAFSMGLVLLVGAILGAITGETLIQMVRVIVVAVILLVSLPFFVIAGAILSLLAFLFQDFSLNSGGQSGRSSSTFGEIFRQLDRWREDFLNPGSRPPGAGLPFDLVSIVTWVLAIVAVVAIVLAASQGVRRSKRKQPRHGSQTREDIGSWALLFRQLRDWLQAIWARIRRRKDAPPSQAADELAALRGRPEWTGTLSIREIYALLQKRAATLGYPRAPYQTPTEYLSVLQSALPDLRRDLLTITSAYIQARYGPFPASSYTVLAATQAWERAGPLLLPPSTNVKEQ